MRKHGPFWLLLMSCLVLVAGCDMFSNPATRIANSIEMGANALGSKEGSTYTLMDITPAVGGECSGPFSVQLDQAGKLTVWCKDAAGHVTSSASTSFYARLVDTPKTYLVDKPAGTTLTINLERLNGRAMIVGVQ